jgi:hypothetical protein
MLINAFADSARGNAMILEINRVHHADAAHAGALALAPPIPVPHIAHSANRKFNHQQRKLRKPCIPLVASRAPRNIAALYLPVKLKQLQPLPQSSC